MDKHSNLVPTQQKVNGQAWVVVHKLQKVWWANSFADMKFFYCQGIKNNNFRPSRLCNY